MERQPQGSGIREADMIKTASSYLCNGCKTDKWNNPEGDFIEVYFGDGNSGTKIHLCAKCAKELIGHIVIAMATKTKGGNDK